LLIWAGCINELASILAILVFKTNAVNLNIYALIEGLLFVVLFYKWSIARRSIGYIITAGILAILWVIDNIWIGGRGNFYCF